MNNKGQTLVLFVIIIPVISYLFIYFYQIGSISVDKRRMNNTIEEALEYGVNNLENELLEFNIKEMIMASDKEVKEENIDVEVIGEEINIVVKKEYKELVMNEEIIFNYTGRINGNDLEIIENRG